MTKKELLDFLAPFDDDIKIEAQLVDEDNTRTSLEAFYRLTKDGRGKIEIWVYA